MISVKIGDWARDYVVAETTAPRQYDGFGTIELYRGGGQRMVAIQKEHLGWHEGRYRSGLYTLDVQEDESVRAWATEKMMKRLLGGDDDEKA